MEKKSKGVKKLSFTDNISNDLPRSETLEGLDVESEFPEDAISVTSGYASSYVRDLFEMSFGDESNPEEDCTEAHDTFHYEV
jgi:hypothetical protein